MNTKIHYPRIYVHLCCHFFFVYLADASILCGINSLFHSLAFGEKMKLQITEHKKKWKIKVETRNKCDFFVGSIFCRCLFSKWIVDAAHCVNGEKSTSFSIISLCRSCISWTTKIIQIQNLHCYGKWRARALQVRIPYEHVYDVWFDSWATFHTMNWIHVRILLLNSVVCMYVRMYKSSNARTTIALPVLVPWCM